MNIKENNKTKITEAQKRAVNKYNKSHYKPITCKTKISEYEQISAYAEIKGLSISKLLLLSVKYCIDNNIDISE